MEVQRDKEFQCSKSSHTSLVTLRDLKIIEKKNAIGT